MNEPGWDPLDEGERNDTEIRSASQKRQIKNILKSYVGMYDPFSELIQNAMDAVDRRAQESSQYKPELWITINLKENSFQIVDNGVGFKEKEFRSFLAPNISFKEAGKARGHKGVGATYIAYGFDHLVMATKGPEHTFLGEITNGRAWVEDKEGIVTRPIIRKIDRKANEFKEFDAINRGSMFKIIFGGSSTRPKDLSWYQATTATQWKYLLLTKTPLGVVSLPKEAKVTPVKYSLVVINKTGEETIETSDSSPYLFPHLLIKSSVNLDDVKAAQKELEKRGLDTSAIPTKYFQTNGIFEYISTDGIKSLRQFSKNQSGLDLIGDYKISAYGYFAYSTQIWDKLNDEIAKLRKGYRFLKGGLQLANNLMIQGDLHVIPLTSDTGYQNQCHIVVHFENADPDLGRKGFQPELKEIAEQISVALVNRFKAWKRLLKPDTGSNTSIDQDTEIFNWIEREVAHEKEAPLVITNQNFFLPSKKIAITSTPQCEQDVIVLFSQLLAGGVIRGVKLLSTSQVRQYDGIFRFVITPPPEFLNFDVSSNPLGISEDGEIPPQEKISPPKILEYKYNLDGLIRDFDSGEKKQKDITLIIAWEMGDEWKKAYQVTSLLDEDNLSHREYHGVTHILQSHHSRMYAIILKELLEYLNEPEAARRYQKEAYSFSLDG